MNIKFTINSLKKYRFLLEQLVSRDFKVKYKRSALGILWSLLYPIMMMAVLAIVFTNIFRVSNPEINFLVYLMIGLTYFNYFNEASNAALGSIIFNSTLIKKVYLPKYIFPLSKVVFVGINFLLSLIPLYLMILITGTGLNIYHLLLPFSFLFLFMFTLGMGYILATMAVFLRDTVYIYGILITIWTYFTPIMYDARILPQAFQGILRLNPMYHYISFARQIIQYHQFPIVGTWVGCIVSSVVVLLVGLVVFKRNQDKFVYYL